MRAIMRNFGDHVSCTQQLLEVTHAFKIANRSIRFFTNNEALVPVIKKHSCKGHLPNFFVQHLFLLCLRYNMLFKAKHLPGTQNHLAAPSSRLEMYKFRHLVPASVAQPATEIHHQLLPQNWQIKFYFW